MDGIRKLLGSTLVGAAVALAGTVAVAQGTAEVMTPSAAITALPGVVRNETLAAGLPASVRSAGVLKVATDLTPPISFHGADGGLVGIDADLARRITSSVLGMMIAELMSGSPSREHVEAYIGELSKWMNDLPRS